MPTNNEVVEVNATPKWVPHATIASRKDEAAKAAMSKAIDAMKADGVKLAWFRKKDDDSEKAKAFREHLKVAIIAGWSQSKQKLLDTPTNALSPAKKKAKKTQQQQIGSKILNFRDSFERRMPNNTGPKPKATDKTFVHTRIDQMLNRLRNAEKPRVSDLAKFIELMDQAKKLMLN